MILTLRKYLKEEKPQIVIPFLTKIAAVTELAMLGMKRKFRVVVSERIDPYSVNYPMVLRWGINRAFNRADAVVFQSERAKSYYSAKIQEKSKIIGNPISVSEKKIDEQDAVIVTAGRLEAQKNQKILIEAFAQIADEFPNYKLHIYGEGGLHSSLEQQIEKLEMKDRIYLMGNQLDYQDKLARAMVFVLPSNFEGLSNALLEAMMLGIPCISSNCAGSDEVITSGKNGLLFPVGDVDALTEQLRTMLIDEELRTNISKAGKESVQRFKVERIISSWRTVLEGSEKDDF